jgi:hypothetical protein
VYRKSGEDLMARFESLIAIYGDEMARARGRTLLAPSFARAPAARMKPRSHD